MPIECKKKNGDDLDSKIDSHNFMCFKYHKNAKVGGEYAHNNVKGFDLTFLTCPQYKDEIKR